MENAKKTKQSTNNILATIKQKTHILNIPIH